AVFSSGVEARYFFSTARSAADFGLVPTHLAPLNKARGAAAALCGLASTHLPLAITSQQYSLAYGSSPIWWAMFLTFPSAISMLPIGSAWQTASSALL